MSSRMNIHPICPILAVLLAATLSGCTSITSTQSLPLPDQGMYVESPQKGRIYVFSKNLYQPVVRVFAQGVAIGPCRGAQYLCWEQDPGEVEIRATCDRSDQLTLNVSAGQRYYITVEALLYMYRGWEVTANLISEREGEAMLAQYSPPAVQIGTITPQKSATQNAPRFKPPQPSAAQY